MLSLLVAVVGSSEVEIGCSSILEVIAGDTFRVGGGVSMLREEAVFLWVKEVVVVVVAILDIRVEVVVVVEMSCCWCFL